jgi:homoserine dehydrogenase
VTEARAAILRAIARGKHVITANKAVLAEHGREIFAAAHAKGVDVYYEAAVCGGVPVIRVLREGLASDRIEQVVGIVNGTSNFILTAMAAEGRAFGDVLAEAQAKGYAEADPTLDVGGGDAGHKLAILAMLCFHSHIESAAIHKDGITELDPIDFEYAARFGYVIKPLVIAREHAHAIELRVHPALVPESWLLASVAGAKNALYVTSYALGPSMYYGAGAGMLPTAMAVVSDMIEIGRNMFSGARAKPPRPVGSRPLLPMSEIRTKYYLRFGVVDQPGVLGQLMTILGAHSVSIARVVQDVGDTVQVVVTTHEAREGDMRAALAEINKLPVVSEPARVIRIAG